MKVEDTTIPITNVDVKKLDTKKYIDEYINGKFEEIKEELDKLSKEIEKINQKIVSQNSYDIAYTEIPPACRHCSNHPSNGGS